MDFSKPPQPFTEEISVDELLEIVNKPGPHLSALSASRDLIEIIDRRPAAEDSSWLWVRPPQTMSFFGVEVIATPGATLPDGILGILFNRFPDGTLDLAGAVVVKR
jgi:hypothetical protein